MRQIIFCFILFISVPAGISFAQQYHFTTCGLTEGLSQDQVLSIHQDHKGYMWFGTNGGGICCFDGKQFTCYDQQSGLAGNVVRGITSDRHGNVWIASYNGLSKWDGLRFTVYTKKDGLHDNRIYSLYCAKDERIWIGTTSGVSVWDGQKFTNFTPLDGIPPSTVFSIIEDGGGNIWLGTFGGGACRFNPGNKDGVDGKSFTVFSKNDGLCSDTVRAMLLDSKNNIWFGTLGGGASVLKDGKFNTYSGTGKVSKYVMGMTEDRHGRIWFGTHTEGLFVFDGSRFTNIRGKNGLSANSVFSCFTDRENNLWFGMDGTGISKLSSERFIRFTDKDGLPGNNIRAIFEDTHGKRWYGTNGNGVIMDDGLKYYEFNKGNKLNTDKILCFTEDCNGNVWMGSDGDGIFCYNGKIFRQYNTGKSFDENRVWSIHCDNGNTLWVGTYGAGLLVMENDSFRRIVSTDSIQPRYVWAIKKAKDSIIYFACDRSIFKYENFILSRLPVKATNSDAWAYSFVTDHLGNLWIGFSGIGLARYMLKEEKTTFYTVKDGLSDNTILAMEMDSFNNLWLGTSRGLDKIPLGDFYSKNIFKPRNYGFSEGFTSISTSMNSILAGKGNMVWIGTSQGVFRYNHLFDGQNKIPPPIYIRQVRLFFEKTGWEHYSEGIDPATSLPVALTLPWHKNHVTIDFTGLSYSAPEKIKYKYFLEGIESGWSPDVAGNSAVYPGLAPGFYTFKTVACNNDGIWSDMPAQFSFYIAPPFWKTFWFYGICIVLLFAGISIYIKLRTAQLLKTKKILEQKVAERTREVVRQKEIIEQKNRDITDSIEYASYIQNAVLPIEEEFKKLFPESFIIYKPRDIVSGDFYWCATPPSYPTEGGKEISPSPQGKVGMVASPPPAGEAGRGAVLLCTADCTGHGVPGAFMSMLCTALLNEAVNDKGLTKPNEIFEIVRKGIISALKQHSGQSGRIKDGMPSELRRTKDGMDATIIALVNWHVETPLMASLHAQNATFLRAACANNPVYIASNGSLTEIPPDHFPVGIFEGSPDGNREKPFTLHEIEINRGDMIYAVTDGFEDQLGGEKGKKLKSKKFKEILVSISCKPIDEQKQILENEFEQWKGAGEQTDDVTVIGIRI